MDVVEEEGSNPNKIYIYCSSIIFDLQIFDPLGINHKMIRFQDFGIKIREIIGLHKRNG